MIQAQGAFDDLCTYNVPLDGDTVNGMFNSFLPDYYLMPYNDMMANIISAPSNPSTNAVTPDVITGAGYLQWDGAVTPIYSTNAYQVWITNITATAAGNGTDERDLHDCQGGQAGYYYDVFATGALNPRSQRHWFWMGQGNSRQYLHSADNQHQRLHYFGDPVRQ